MRVNNYTPGAGTFGGVSGTAWPNETKFQYLSDQNPPLPLSDIAGGAVLKVWTGAAWANAVLKRYNGATWVSATLKYWDGAAWSAVDSNG